MRTTEVSTEYDVWLAEVGRIVQVRAGISMEDIPALPFKRWFKEGLTPRAVASRALLGVKR